MAGTCAGVWRSGGFGSALAPAPWARPAVFARISVRSGVFGTAREIFALDAGMGELSPASRSDRQFLVVVWSFWRRSRESGDRFLPRGTAASFWERPRGSWSRRENLGAVARIWRTSRDLGDRSEIRFVVGFDRTLIDADREHEIPKGRDVACRRLIHEPREDLAEQAQGWNRTRQCAQILRGAAKAVRIAALELLGASLDQVEKSGPCGNRGPFGSGHANTLSRARRGAATSHWQDTGDVAPCYFC